LSLRAPTKREAQSARIFNLQPEDKMSSTSIKRAAYNLMHDSEKSLDDIAAWLQKSPHTLRAEVNPNIATAKLGFDDVVAATMFTGNMVALNAFAAELNCILIALPEDTNALGTGPDMPGLMRGVATLIERVSKPGQITPNDLAAAEEAAANLLGSVQRCIKHMATASTMTRSFDQWVAA
jgi:hypothetical protein